MIHDRFSRAALRYIQEFEPLTYEIPQGTRLDPGSCPIANATGAYVDDTIYPSKWKDGKAFTGIPLDVNHFVARFDNGHYPELIDPNRPVDEDAKIIVEHASYGCDTGCCGHVLKIDDREVDFNFFHPYGEDLRKWAEKYIRAELGEEHVKDLDWENSYVVDDC